MFVGLGTSQLFEVWRRRARISVVGEDRTRAEHHAVFDRDRAANVNEGVYLDAVTDDHAGSYVAFLSYNALLAEFRRMTDVHVVPNRCAFADLNVIFDDRSRMNANRSWDG